MLSWHLGRGEPNRQSILGAIALAICAIHVGINDRALADEPVVSCTLMKEWPPHSAFSQRVFRLPTAEARDADLLAQSEPEKCGPNGASGRYAMTAEAEKCPESSA
jgi:hypothetical protein